MCPYCGSKDISCHLGRCECNDCGAEWSTEEDDDGPIIAAEIGG